MNFQGLITVETASNLIDIAFNKAKKAADLEHGKKMNLRASRLDMFKNIDLRRIGVISEVLRTKLMNINVSFPKIDELAPFYKELINLTVDYHELKNSLGSIYWAWGKINDFEKEYTIKIKKATTIGNVDQHRKSFYGRVSNIINKLKTHLFFLEACRKVMKEYPTIKQNWFTIAISGFPNTGKSTLLSKITGSTPEIRSYAFTTKGINVGYLRSKKLQVLDTPGTLNRDKLNNLEKIAELAIERCTHLIIYVFDLTEGSMDLDSQIKLYEVMTKFNKPLVVYLSKSDLQNTQTVKYQDFKKKYNAIDNIDQLNMVLGIRQKEFEKEHDKDKEEKDKLHNLSDGYRNRDLGKDKSNKRFDEEDDNEEEEENHDFNEEKEIRKIRKQVKIEYD